MFLLEDFASPVKIYPSGVVTEGFIPFEIIDEIYCEHNSKRANTMFLFKLESGFVEKFHVKERDTFISTLKQIYGEEKWREIFKVNSELSSANK